MIVLFSIPIEITLYFLATLIISLSMIGAMCYTIFGNDPLDLHFHKLMEDLEGKLEADREDIKSTTEGSLAKLGLREFQTKDGIKNLQRRFEEKWIELEQTLKTHGKHLGATNKKLVHIERKVDQLKTAQRNLPKLEKKLATLKTVQDSLTGIKGVMQKIDSVPKPYVHSADKIERLKGSLLKQDTVQQLDQEGVKKVEDLLLKSPMEIAMTKAMSEAEAKDLQGIVQLLMVPGIQLDDAVLLLKSGINSKQELAMQESFNLGARISKTAEMYIREGKIRKREKPTLEEVDSWIRCART